jgi:hypothetical protein
LFAEFRVASNVAEKDADIHFSRRPFARVAAAIAIRRIEGVRSDAPKSGYDRKGSANIFLAKLARG